MSAKLVAAHVRPGGVMLMIGTTKGAFLLASDARRAKWDLTGPYLTGTSVYSMYFDARGGRSRIHAGAKSYHFGAAILTSDDFGATWSNPEAAPIRFPEGSDRSLEHIWQIMPALGDDHTLWAGVEPAALFVSRDAGATWSLVTGLDEHPHRPQWMPGGGGLALHTIVPHPKDPARMLVAISSGGAYRTADGGATWEPANRGVRAEFMPEKFPEWGQCVHKVVRDPVKPKRLYLQNHWGLYRSDDEGGRWKDIANGVPSDFGFAMAAHPRDPDTVFIVPMESDGFRCAPAARLRVYVTRDAGKSWQALSRGLPQRNAYETVLRDGLCTDTHATAGVYFGTRSGKVFASTNDGRSWKTLVDGLPPVVCVKAATFPAAAPKAVTKTVARPARRKART